MHLWCLHACAARTQYVLSHVLTRQLSGSAMFRPCLRSDACMWHACGMRVVPVLHAWCMQCHVGCRLLLAVRLCSEHMSRVWQHDAPDSLLTRGLGC